MTVTQILNAEI
jgi:hypothetical protein